MTTLLGLMRTWHAHFNLEPSFKLATRPADSLGTAEQWETAERALYDARPISKNGYKVELAASLLRDAIAKLA